MAAATCDVCSSAIGGDAFSLTVTPHDQGREMGAWSACSYDCLVILAELLRDSSFDSESEREFGGGA